LLRKITLLLSLVLTLAFTSTAVVAQEVPAMDPSEVEGLESAYGRMYMVDIDAIMASPEAAEAILSGESPLSGMAAAFLFEDEGAAEGAMGDFADQFAESFLEGAEVEAEESEIEGLGDEAVIYTGTTDVDETTTADTAMIIARDGENIFISFIIGGTDVEGMVDDMAQHMIDGEIGADEVVLDEAGASTGGVFDIFPGAETADLVGGMVPFMDIDFLEGGSFDL
jgi:hypothetical protein